MPKVFAKPLVGASVPDPSLDDEDLFHEAARLPLNDFYKPHDRSSDVQDWGPSLTRQEFVEECDINTIMARYEKTGQLPMNVRGEPVYMDFSQVPDNLADALQHMHAASEEFMRLPAHVRREFDNDPLKFTEFAMDPNNLDQMGAWGLAEPRPAPPAAAAPAEPPAAPAAPAASGGPK